MTVSSRSMKQAGFTIVELLIVIVIIGILAAITIVAYNGVQNRANNTAVTADLSNMAKQMQLSYVDKGRYPNGVAELTDVKLKVSKSAYAIAPTVQVNLAYCTNGAQSGFAIIAMSKSGQRYVVTQANTAPVIDNTGMTWDATTSSLANQCGALGYDAPLSHGYYSAGEPWRAWVGGN